MGMVREPRFGSLLAGIILFLFSGPLANEFFNDTDDLLLMLGFNGLLIFGIWSLQENRMLFRIGVALAAIDILLTFINPLTEDMVPRLLASFILLIFIGISIWLAARHLFSPGQISFNRIMGGICIYLLLGIAWTLLYAYLQAYDTGAFAGAGLTESREQFWNLAYFSFVTLTTLGYGDIYPIHPIAKVFAYAEAITGQLFIAILIGSLVGNYIAGRQTSN